MAADLIDVKKEMGTNDFGGAKTAHGLIYLF